MLYLRSSKNTSQPFHRVDLLNFFQIYNVSEGNAKIQKNMKENPLATLYQKAFESNLLSSLLTAILCTDPLQAVDPSGVTIQIVDNYLFL